MNRYPILFGPIGGLVAGNGFIAHVLIRGRCILEETSEDFSSALGVNPGAVAGDGANLSEAYHDLLERVHLVVFDIAEEAENFDAFADQVRRFVLETNRPNEGDWKTAVAKVRSGELDLEGVRREDADRDSDVEITLVAPEFSEAADRQAISPRLNEPTPAHDGFEIAA
jgi:hypothetical protein